MKNYLLLIISVIIGLIVSELVLRYVFGIVPGIHSYDRNLKIVDSLFTLKGFYADSAGIFRVDPTTVSDFENRLAGQDNKKSDTLHYNNETEIDEIYSVIDDMRNLRRGEVNNSFSKKYFEILNGKKKALSEYDSLILYFVNHPINEDGFLSIPFKKLNTPKKKILLLGDSFTWGRTVPNITSSFANELFSKGYVVYNTGISGADPQQYLALARKLIPQLSPDIVIVNFYMGNDIAFFPRPVLPYKPLMYRTNAGYLMGCPLGIHFNSAQHAYDFVITECSIPQTSAFNRFLSLTATGSLFWKMLFVLKLVDGSHPQHNEYWKKTRELMTDTPFCNHEIGEIKKIAQKNGSTCIVSVIRDMAHKEQYDPSLVSNLLTNIPYVISGIKEDGYSKGDWHFNEKGHRQYADFLDSLMKQN